MPFWRARSTQRDHTDLKPTTPATSSPLNYANFALETIVRLSERTEIVEEACIVDNQICLRIAVTYPNLNRPVAFLHDVALWPLLEMARTSMGVNDLIDLWAAHIPRQKALSDCPMASGPAGLGAYSILTHKSLVMAVLVPRVLLKELRFGDQISVWHFDLSGVVRA
jgi:hypothetical protein